VLTHRYSSALWLGIYVLLQVAASFLSLPAHSPSWLVLTAALISAGLFIFVSLAVCASFAYAVRRPAHAAVLLVVGAAGWWLMLALGPLPPNPPNLMRAGPLAFMVLHNSEEVCRILATVGLGVLLASAIRERNILLPAAVFAAFADFFMVRFGTVHHEMKTQAGQHLVTAMSAKVPMVRGLPVLTVGPADFVFIAFFFACVYRFDLHLKRTFIALFFLLTLSLFFVLIIGPIPALAPMALGFVSVNFRRFKLSRSEIQAMAAAAAIVLIVTLAYLFWGKV
jgi:hypothetical protein